MMVYKSTTKLIGERIKWLRQGQYLTQEQLAVKADVSYSSVRRVEHGGRGGSRIATLKLIAAALDVTLEYLLNGRVA